MANDPRLTKKFTKFDGKLYMIGFGSIGQGVLPLLLRHIDIKPEQIQIITGDERGEKVAKEMGVAHKIQPIKKDNVREVIGGLLNKGDFLLSLCVDVESKTLRAIAAEKGALYLDTVVEPWGEVYDDPNIAMPDRTNYALRESMLNDKKNVPSDASTQITCHGANPGLVTHFIKRALLNIAKDNGQNIEAPKTSRGWAELARDLEIKVIHVAERDTQIADAPKEMGEFVNTWSVHGFYGEGVQPAELGWGSHEKHFPHDGMRQEKGESKAAIYLKRPGATTKVRTWTPMEGPFHGFCVTHHESVSTADHFSIVEDGKVVYRPTVHYAYHPCDAAVMSLHELAGKNFQLQDRTRILMDEITSGVDELGVLLCGNKKGAYWYGSQLSIEDSRRLVPYNNATSLQVTAAVLAGVIWAMDNPNRGVVEPEELDHERILEICEPYIEPLHGEYTDWNPIKDRTPLFEDEMDESDPWQFKNVRVTF